MTAGQIILFSALAAGFFLWLLSVEGSVAKLAAACTKEARRVAHLENEHIKLERKVTAFERPEDECDEGDGGPYRSTDRATDDAEDNATESSADEDPLFVPGGTVDVSFDEGKRWFRARFDALITTDARKPFVRITCGSREPELFELSRIEMRVPKGVHADGGER